MLLGQLDHYNPLDRKLKGWMAGGGDVPSTCTVVVMNNDKVVVEVVADEYREDLEQEGINEGFHAFSITLPELPVGAVITIQDKVSGTSLLNGRVEIKSPESVVLFNIDDVTSTHISGWVIHQLYNCLLPVKFTLNDEVIAEGVADEKRVDIDGKQCGFSLPLSRTLDSLPAKLNFFVEGVLISQNHIVLPVNINDLVNEAISNAEKNTVATILGLERSVRQLIDKTQLLDLSIASNTKEVQRLNAHNDEVIDSPPATNLEQENELLLLQLHKVQEELEQYIVKHQ